jgi:hypothetical protein
VGKEKIETTLALLNNFLINSVKNIISLISYTGRWVTMRKNFTDFDSIKDVLKASIEQKVTIILISGQKLTVEVEAVIDNLLVASIDGKILFIDIECICVVITCCEEILESLLGKNHRKREEEESRKHEKCDF